MKTKKKKETKGGVFKIVNKITGDIWICASMDMEKEYNDIMQSCDDNTFEELFQEEIINPNPPRVCRISRKGTPKYKDSVH